MSLLDTSLPGFPVFNDIMTPTTVPSFFNNNNNNNNNNNTRLVSTSPSTTTLTQSIGGIIMTPRSATTATATTSAATGVTAGAATSPTLGGSATSSTTTPVPRNVSQTSTAASTPDDQVSTTPENSPLATTPLVIQAPPPTQTPGHGSCPDLRDRISIDISITTTTTTTSQNSNRNTINNNGNDNNNNNNNNNNINSQNESTNSSGTSNNSSSTSPQTLQMSLHQPAVSAPKRHRSARSASDAGANSAGSAGANSAGSAGANSAGSAGSAGANSAGSAGSAGAKGSGASHSGSHTADVILSTRDRRVGTVVQVTCSADQQTVVLECGPGGVWNASVPACSGGLDTSPYRVYLAVAGGAATLVLLVLCFLYCRLLKTRRRGDKPTPASSAGNQRHRDADGNLYVDPYHVGERLYGSPNSPHYCRSDIQYAKPVVYSTYLNPAFYEDAYERWRRQEQLVAEKLYDSPWLKPKNLHRQMETPGFRWSQTSLRTIGDSGFKKLPRAQLSIDHSSVRSNASIGGNRARDPMRSQSTSVAPCEMGMLRLYPSMAAHDTSRPRPMTSPDDVLTEDNESLTDDEMKSTDGLTNL